MEGGGGLFLAVMRSQGDDCNVDFGIVDFVNHAILLVDAARPCFLKGIVPQMFHLTGACARMLLKFHEHAGNLFECGFVATLFDDCKLGSLQPQKEVRCRVWATAN